MKREEKITFIEEKKLAKEIEEKQAKFNNIAQSDPIKAGAKFAQFRVMKKKLEPKDLI